MKRIIFLVILIFIIPLGLAISSDLKEEYKSGETIIIKISGNILDNIEKERVEFKRKHVGIPVEFEIKKLKDEWYIWAIAPFNENNYTLLIREISTTVDGKSENVDYEKNFSVIGERVDYNVKPGAITATNDFSIIINSFKDNIFTISTNFPETREFLINPGENKLDFSINSIEENSFVVIELGIYKIPAYITKINKFEDNLTDYFSSIRFRPRIVQSTILFNTKPIYPIEIVNEGEKEIIVNLDVNSDLLITPIVKDIKIGSNESYLFNLSIKENIKENINYTITARGEGFILELPIEILVTEDKDEVKTLYLEKNFDENLLFSCLELNGIICSAEQECNGKALQSKDGLCCRGECIAKEKERSYGWIGYLIAGIAILIIAYAWLRYKKTKSSNSIEKAFEKAENKI